MKYDVFISYSRKDTAIADQICAAFDKARISYFIDRQGIGGGMEFPKVLAPAIRESEIFLLLASQNAYDSAYTDREITFAFNKKRGEKMLPYIIDSTFLPEHLELIFSSNNWLIMKSHPIETRLVDDVLRLLGRTRPKAENTLHQKQERNVDSTTETKDEFKLKCQEKDGKYGFVDEKGNVVIPFNYDSCFPCYTQIGKSYFDVDEGLCCVAKNKKCGFIDKKGNIVIPFKYGEPAANCWQEGIFFIQSEEGETWWNDGHGLRDNYKEGKIGAIDTKGNVVIPFKYDDVLYDPIKGGSAIIEDLACLKKHGKWGYIDKKGKVIIPFKFKAAEAFHNGKAKVTKKSIFGKEQTFYIDKHGNRYYAKH